MAEQSNETAAQSAFMCQLCDQQNVKWKCEDCGIFICNLCKEKVHPRLKSSDKHRVMSVKDIGKVIFIHTVKEICARINQIPFLCNTVKKIASKCRILQHISMNSSCITSNYALKKTHGYIS